MKKYFVISDIHSFYDEMQAALNEAGYDKENENHILISCGDLFDRGKKSRECLEFIMSIPEERRILIKGNHEELLEELLNGRYIEDYDKHNGTISTIEQLSNNKKLYNALEEVKKNELLQEYLNSLKDYYADKDYIFCHGYIPWEYIQSIVPTITYNFEASKDEWKKARWTNGMYQWNVHKLVQNVYGAELLDKRTIVCGHWHVSYGHAVLHKFKNEFPRKGVSWKKDCCFDIFKDDGIVALDACTALTHKVNVFVIER